MELNTALKQAAQNLVTNFSLVDWDRVKEHEFKTVVITFPSERAALDAKQIFLQMAAGEPAVRSALIARIKNLFQGRGLPLHPDTSDKTNTSRRNVEDLLETLAKTGSPASFARQCVQARLLFNRVSLNASKGHPNRLKRGILPTPRPMAPHRPTSKASWLWRVTERELSVQTELVFAEPVVGLSRRIARMNTGKVPLSLEAADLHPLQLRRRLLAECEPESYQFPDDDHPFGHELQKILDQFAPALRDFLVICGKSIHTDKANSSAAASISPVSPRTEIPTKTEPTSGPAEKPTMASHAKFSVDVDSEGAPADQNSRVDLAQIEITSQLYVIVNGKRIRETDQYNALLTLAAKAGDLGTEQRINTREFIKLSHRVDSNTAKRWNKTKDNLSKIFGIKADMIHGGSWHLSGFKIILNPKVTVQMIEDYLLKQPERVKPKKVRGAR